MRVLSTSCQGFGNFRYIMDMLAGVVNITCHRQHHHHNSPPGSQEDMFYDEALLTMLMMKMTEMMAVVK